MNSCTTSGQRKVADMDENNFQNSLWRTEFQLEDEENYIISSIQDRFGMNQSIERFEEPHNLGKVTVFENQQKSTSQNSTFHKNVE